MCGRYTLTSHEDLAARFGLGALAETRIEPRFNVAPSQGVPVIVARDDGPTLTTMRWGFQPAWMKGDGQRPPPINARSESLLERPMFRGAVAHGRCLIPADGFYEWRREGKRKQPFLIHTPTDAPLAFAGLWAPWKDQATGEWLLSAAVVTTAANATVSQLHNRMPVILDEEAWRLWVDADLRDEGLLASLLVPASDELLELRPASPLVNNANNEGPELAAEPEPEAEAPDAAAEQPLTLFG
jgi:putative SOS response-associated peptidase YedK